jgi:hypothetical protein
MSARNQVSERYRSRHEGTIKLARDDGGDRRQDQPDEHLIPGHSAAGFRRSARSISLTPTIATKAPNTVTPIGRMTKANH